MLIFNFLDIAKIAVLAFLLGLGIGVIAGAMLVSKYDKERCHDGK